MLESEFLVRSKSRVYPLYKFLKNNLYLISAPDISILNDMSPLTVSCLSKNIRIFTQPYCTALLVTADTFILVLKLPGGERCLQQF